MKNLEDTFYSGHYPEVLSHTIDSAKWAGSAKEMPFVVGALCFTGRMSEAQHLFDSRNDGLSPAERAASRFYLAMGYTRLSKYNTAIKLLGANLKIAKTSKNKQILYYSYQGLAFFRYYSGRFHLSLKWSERAYPFADSIRFHYGKILSLDLRAHSLIRLGETSKGMRLFSQATNLAKNLNCKAIIQAIEISKMTYRFRYGIDSPKINKLKVMIEGYNKDNYSQAQLLLEGARFCCITGDLKLANELLDQACPLIYQSDNRRQEISLNLRYAYMNYLHGDFAYALNLLKNANRLIHRKFEPQIELELIGLEVKVLDSLGYNSESKLKSEQIKRLTQYTQEYVSKNILNRVQGISNSIQRQDEDPIGDLKQLISNDFDENIDTVIQSGYLSLLRAPLDVSLSSTQIFIDLVKDTFIVFKKGNITLHRNITAQNKKMAVLLQADTLSKSELFEKNWGLNYDPDRHDAVIHAAIAQLRKSLSINRDLVIFDESGYRLMAEVHIYSSSRRSQADELKSGPNFTAKFSGTEPHHKNRQNIDVINVPADLNWRQIKIINLKNRSDFYDVKHWIKTFQVSKITASRDLSQLVEQGYFRRIGKGRATKYLLLNSIGEVS